MCLQSQFIEEDSEHSGEMMRGAKRWGAEGEAMRKDKSEDKADVGGA